MDEYPKSCTPDPKPSAPEQSPMTLEPSNPEFPSQSRVAYSEGGGESQEALRAKSAVGLGTQSPPVKLGV